MMHFMSTSIPAVATVSCRGNSNTGASNGSSPADTYESSEESVKKDVLNLQYCTKVLIKMF